MFAYVNCRCGRTLRARRSPERAAIRCWDCGEEVVVRPYYPPDENPILRVRRALDTRRLESFALLVLLALATVVALLVPRVGLLAALAVISGAAILYLRQFQAPGREAVIEADGAPRRRGRSARLGAALARWLLALGFAAGMALPFWLTDGSRQLVASPPLVPGPAMLALAGVVWVGLPMVMYVLMARDGGRLGIRRALAAVGRRPLATLGALLAFPLAVAAMEALLVGGHATTDRYLEYLVADLFPLPEGTRVRYGLIMVDRAALFEPPDGLEWYLDGLRRGTTLVGSIPLSLSRGLEAKVSPRAFGISSREFYLLARLGYSAVIFFVLYGTLGLQVRLFGLIARSDPAEPTGREQPAERPAPEPAETA